MDYLVYCCQLSPQHPGQEPETRERVTVAQRTHGKKTASVHVRIYFMPFIRVLCTRICADRLPALTFSTLTPSRNVVQPLPRAPLAATPPPAGGGGLLGSATQLLAALHKQQKKRVESGSQKHVDPSTCNSTLRRAERKTTRETMASSLEEGRLKFIVVMFML